VYLRHNTQLTNSAYRRLNYVDSVTATKDLRSLLQLGLIEQHSTRRWAYYTLSVPAAVETARVPLTDEEKILAYVREHRSTSNPECRRLLGVDIYKASNLLRSMHRRGLLRQQGERIQLWP
jgi:predicted HTH transcriptional regulator